MTKNKRIQAGTSILEALIGLAVLSAGITAFAKSQSFIINSNMYIQDQLMNLNGGGELNNMVALRALALNDNNPTAFARQVEQYAAKLESDINLRQKQLGYRCVKEGTLNVPEQDPGSSASTRVSGGTVTRLLRTGAQSCVSIVVSTQDTVPDVPNVWVTTRVTWMSRGLNEDRTQFVDSSKLVVGKSIPAAYTKHWY